ncbi:putative cytochrome P450 family protein, partial [Listeria monocytogenes FSL F2-208]
VYKNVQKMNYEMINLFNETKEQQRKWEAHNVAWSTGASPYKVEVEFGYDLIDGASTSVFYHSKGQNDSDVNCYL